MDFSSPAPAVSEEIIGMFDEYFWTDVEYHTGDIKIKSDDVSLQQKSALECASNFLHAEDTISISDDVSLSQNSALECGPNFPHMEDAIKYTKKSKKRQKNYDMWVSTVRKRLRESIKPYVSINKKEVPGRVLKSPCNNCYLKCMTIFSHDDRMQIHQAFWNMCDDEKTKYYFKFVTRHPVKRRRGNSSLKQFSFLYYFEKDTFTYRVCRKFFLNTLCIDQKRIYYCFEQFNDAKVGVPLGRKKGKHVKRVTPDDNLSDVRAHISSFPTIDSHYCRSNSKRKYIDGSLNLNKMYFLYRQNTEYHPVGIHIYRKVFNNDFNISFFKPKKDQCDKCVSFHNKDNILTTSEKLIYEKHKAEKEALKLDRDNDRQNVHSSKCIICYDLQSVFSLPKGNASMFYYKRKLSMFNLTATIIMPNIPTFTYCALWTEAQSGRSGNDIASALIKILKQLVKDYPALKTLTLWSDSCVPQNKNRINSTAIKIFLKQHNITTIIHKFSEPGHSLIQEVDCVHGVIDRYLKNVEIHSPLHLMQLLRNMPANKTKLKVIEMLPEDFHSYSVLANKMDFRKVPFAKIKVMLYKKNEEYHLRYKTSAKDKEFQNAILLKSASRNCLETPQNLLQQTLKISTPSTIQNDKKKKGFKRLIYISSK